MFSPARIPADPTKAVTAIAMGQNTFARSGSLMIGTHNYKGALGDTTVDTSNTRKMSLQLYSTTLGTNSFNNGAFATVTGAYNIASSAYDGGRLSAFSEGMKNFGATIYGTLNSIESMSGSSNNGMANTITGVANRTQNANGAIIIGAGNEITNSYKYINVSSSGAENANSAKAFADAIRDAVKQSQSGGAVRGRRQHHRQYPPFPGVRGQQPLAGNQRTVGRGPYKRRRQRRRFPPQHDDHRDGKQGFPDPCDPAPWRQEKADRRPEFRDFGVGRQRNGTDRFESDHPGI